MFNVLLTTLMLPYAVTLIPTFLLWAKLDLINTFWPLIIPHWFGGGIFSIFLLRQFFRTIPRELDEAALIDGANPLQILWNIIVPLSRPALIAVGIFAALSSWNDFLGPLIYLNDSRNFTLALGLAEFTGLYSSQWHLLMAASTVVIDFELQGGGDFPLMLRVPAWCEAGAELVVSGEAWSEPLTSGSYVRVERTWTPGDTVRLTLPMPVRYLEAHPYVTENIGRVAVARGPLLYCAEGLDHNVDIRDLYAPASSGQLKTAETDELGGVVMLRGKIVAGTADDAGYLYRSVVSTELDQPVAASLVAVPYYSWANREGSPMQVWLRRQS